MPMTKEQKIVVDFYEAMGNATEKHLTDIIDGPLVHNFILNPSGQTNIRTIIKNARKNNYMISCLKQQIIVQIPKETAQTIPLENLLKSKEFKNTNAVLPIVMGVDTFGNIMINDLRKMPHVLVAGRTGCGKSMFFNCILKSLQVAVTSAECKFMILDPKGVDYDMWESDKHLMCPIVKLDADVAVQKLREVSEIIEERYQKLQTNKVKNIEEYKKKTNKKDMPYIVVLIDEFADLITVACKEVESYVQYIVRNARTVGIHLILGTQHIGKDVLPAVIKENMPTRIAFRTRTSAESMQILNERGAEILLPCADMLFSDGGQVPVRIHAPYVKY